MKRNTIIEIIAVLFSAVFLYTGTNKFLDFYVFRTQLLLSPLLAPEAEWIAVVLPVLEIIVSLVLLIPAIRFIGLYASFGFMLTFTGYVIYILSFNEHLPCTCGGFIQALSWRQHLLFNVFLLTLSIVAIVLMKKSATINAKPAFTRP